MEFGSDPSDRNLLISAQFLHKELAIRIARRSIELEALPYGLSEKPAVLKVIYLFFSFRILKFWVASCMPVRCDFFASGTGKIVVNDNY